MTDPMTKLQAAEALAEAVESARALIVEMKPTAVQKGSYWGNRIDGPMRLIDKALAAYDAAPPDDRSTFSSQDSAEVWEALRTLALGVSPEVWQDIRNKVRRALRTGAAENKALWDNLAEREETIAKVREWAETQDEPDTDPGYTQAKRDALRVLEGDTA